MRALVISKRAGHVTFGPIELTWAIGYSVLPGMGGRENAWSGSITEKHFRGACG
jgi:hypothetical protein